MKFTKGTVTGRLESADGTEKSFELTGTSLEDAGKGTGKGIEKGSKVTVYYTEEGGKKVGYCLAQQRTNDSVLSIRRIHALIDIQLASQIPLVEAQE